MLIKIPSIFSKCLTWAWARLVTISIQPNEKYHCQQLQKNGCWKKEKWRGGFLGQPKGRIFSQTGNELGASSFPARNELSMLFPYNSLPAGNELVLKLTKNTASDFELKIIIALKMLFLLFWITNPHDVYDVPISI